MVGLLNTYTSNSCNVQKPIKQEEMSASKGKKAAESRWENSHWLAVSRHPAHQQATHRPVPSIAPATAPFSAFQRQPCVESIVSPNTWKGKNRGAQARGCCASSQQKQQAAQRCCRFGWAILKAAGRYSSTAAGVLADGWSARPHARPTD